MTSARPTPRVGPPQGADAGDAAGTRNRPNCHTDWLAALAWIAMVAPVLPWGLPDRSRDGLLFGGSPAWAAADFRARDALAARSTRSAGADTDLDPLTRHDAPVELSATDAERAQILRRYRLFSRQPDEMITFMALQRMRPRDGDLDPGLYQYGGAWIYGVGAALGVCGAAGIVTLTSNSDVYLEQPELFARFYVVARCLALLGGGLLLVGAMRIARRLTDGRGAWLTALCIMVCPVFLTMSLEAKPHLPSACLIVWATLAALRYVQRGRRRDAIWLGAAAGGAAGFVLTGFVSAALLPAAWLARRAAGRGATESEYSRSRGYLLPAAGVLIAVYAATNPYVVRNALMGRDILRSNVANSTAMYSASRVFEGAARVGVLLSEATGPGMLIVGGLGALGLLLSRRYEALVVGSAGLAMLAIATVLGAGKPAEYARFLLVPAVALAISAAWALCKLSQRTRGAGVMSAALLLLLGAFRCREYGEAFARDAGAAESRRAAAEFIATAGNRDDAVAVIQEPAPYAVPPIDFAHRRVVLLPAVEPAAAALDSLPPWLVYTADDEYDHVGAWWRRMYAPLRRFAPPNPPRIPWANKPVFVLRRVDLRAAPED